MCVCVCRPPHGLENLLHDSRYVPISLKNQLSSNHSGLAVSWPTMMNVGGARETAGSPVRHFIILKGALERPLCAFLMH